MPTKTPGYGFTKPDPTEFYDVAVQNDNWDKNEVEIKKLNDKLDPNVSIPTALSFTPTTINKTGTEPTPLNVKFTPRHYVNLLGKDGNCEDVGKWGMFRINISLDSTTKVFGSNSIKITSTHIDGGSLNKVPFAYDSSKNYLITAYVKNGNCTGGLNIHTNNGQTAFCADTTKFTRIGLKISGNNANFVAIGTSGTAIDQYGWVDGIMVNEISATEYANDSIETLMARYPYTDSLAVTKNLFLESVHGNLIRNGNCEEGVAGWESSGSGAVITVENGRFKVVNTLGNWIQRKIKVTKNTDYYYSHNVTNVGGEIKGSSGTLRYGSGVFNTGNNDEITVFYYGASTGTYYFDSVSITKGTTAPPSYQSYDAERCVIEGDFFTGDTPRLEGGQVKGQKLWKRKTLFGKDFDWKFASDASGYKLLNIQNYGVARGHVNTSEITVKYNGSILKHQDAITTFDSTSLYNDTFWVSVNDTDSGWTETLNPNDDEVKAFMNGWQARQNDGTRYVIFSSIIDGSFPFVTTMASGTNNSGQAVLNVVDASKIAVGEWFSVRYGDFDIFTTYVLSKNGNAITCASNLPISFSSNNEIIRHDITGSSTNIISFCKSNIAPNYEGYQLAYQLATPQPINEDSDSYFAPLKGTVPVLKQGVNVVTFDTGIVLSEDANVVVDWNYAVINQNAPIALYTTSALKFKTQKINKIYKNNIDDTVNWTFDSTYANGLERAWRNKTNHDPLANYTVDYSILRTVTPQIGTAEASYSEGLVDSVSELYELIEIKQNQSVVLDTIVDKAMYEKISLGSLHLTPVYENGILYQSLILPIAQKLVKPMITLESITIRQTNAQIVTSNYKLLGVYYGGTYIKINFSTTDTTLIANRTDGAYVAGVVTLDCRGVI